MENSNLENTVPSNLEEENVVEQTNGPKIVQTDVDSKTGQNKCPKCGATDVSLNVKNGKLRCNFCRYEFQPQEVEGLENDLNKLEGQVLTSGAKDIDKDSSDMITLKCTSCGAEVVIDTASSSQARCHWCRNYLSINNQLPNGSIPDAVLPFKLTKKEAQVEIEKFVGKRKFFANPKFKKEFTTENIIGVYFPYMVIDMNLHANLAGQGEHLVRRYTVGSDDNKKTYYDADLYNVEREFDLVIDDLTIESSKEKLSRTSDKTNNIINSIMPFDTENCVKFDANYIKGYNSEKRDTNVSDIKPLAQSQAKDIAKFSVNDTLKTYDRGVKWNKQDIDIKGEQWKTAYLPVWLYSYQEKKGGKSLLHYVAVNARTKETMGSVPIHMPKLLIASVIAEFIGIFLFSLGRDSDYAWPLLLTGIVYYIAMYLRYRNSNARHKYETETKTEVSNLRQEDNFVEHRKGLRNARMDGANNKSVSGEQSLSSKALKMLSGGEELEELIEKTVQKK